MTRRLRPLARLEGEQLAASAPLGHAALSASAGTGKTHVLTARVLRLLLAGVDPPTILCLTFTKAGAAEMAQRIHERLAYWVRLKDEELGRELVALGESPGPGMRARARTLFARVLDARGGGLRIQTIHAFAQGLLAAFPAEAGLVPGFRPMEAREERLLARSTLADLLVRAEQGSDLPLIADLQALSHRMGEGGAEGFLMACARRPEAMAELGAREGIEPRLRRAFGLPAGDIDQALAEACCDDLFDMATLRRIADANRSWGTPTGLDCFEVIAAWKARSNPERAATLDDIAGLVLTKSGEARKASAGLLKASPDYSDHSERLIECCRRLLGMKRLAALVGALAAGLRAGRAFAEAYAAAKRAHGVVDFDDLIRWTEALLSEPGMGGWVRFKLDQATDHILVDEAQDTNASQWSIVGALAEEYFAGEGAGGRHRTIFTVGDFKQAIFGFQGTDPRQFEDARRYFEAKARAVRDSALEMELPERRVPPEFLDLSMDLSFRSSPPILGLVDRVIADLGHDALGLPRRPRPHSSHHSGRPGSVMLWKPFAAESGDEGEGAGEESWVSDTVRRYAGRLARQIRHWLDHPFRIESKGRALRPEDILILVRRRGELASLLVARLHAEGVPVAGVDRLLLSAPLAVQDLLAAARFALQPLDDLNLASLLVSPLFGWSQDELFQAAFGRSGPLWPHLRGQAARHPEALDGLHQLLAMADFATPHLFFETILSGPLQGRRKLFERLGAEARDPVDELLAGALDFESGGTPSLEGFLDWFARGDVEIVRDPAAPLDAVRVMTVHGSKGLQSPILILADACADPDRKGGGLRGNFTNFTFPEGPTVPIFRPRKEELAEPLKSQVEALDRLEREEHWRLLYVALTRAEERLYIGGALGPADRHGPAEASWYSAVEAAMTGMGCEWEGSPLWGSQCRNGPAESPARSETRRDEARAALPTWLERPAPDEPRPPRPLAPSAAPEGEVAEPPPGPEARRAALRGKLLHQLFERLPEVPERDRTDAADRWLEGSAGISDPTFRSALVADSCAILSDPRFSALFGPESLPEAPIAAVIEGGRVVSGAVDRLLIAEDRILVADFKTGRFVPSTLDEVPAAHLRQMASYAAALRAIFPDRPVEAALLYTAGPLLLTLPSQLLDRYLPAEAAS
ncbi:double-strand break repair helicase AddA [Allosphingosinicella sp.]|jgi:ATP-dependent helicase/nuclease subunit A|uniref:double-strand break repair helicase AddA n=1 Tax=Allosphingosinicella sp. TaxID=2823234 RepID=UPI002EE609D6